MRRVLAVVGAAAMVAGSLALRARLDRTRAERSQTLRLTCATELEVACRRLAGGDGRIRLTVEPAGTTADRLASVDADPGLDGWLASAPWPELVDLRRRAGALSPLFPTARPVLARSPLVLAMWRDREEALEPRCAGAVGWKCLGEAAGTAGGWKDVGGRPEWGSVKPGHAPPTSDGVGLLVLGQASGAWFGKADVAAADLDDDAFQRWFSGLEKAVPTSTTSPLATMLTTGRAAFDAVGALEAEAGPLLATAARGSEVDLLYPSPMATADIVMAVTGGSAATALCDIGSGGSARSALAAAGWRVEGQPRATGVPATPALPPTAGLPAPGLLDALRTRWHEVTGR